MYVKFSMFMTLEVKKFCKWVNSQKFLYLKYQNQCSKAFSCRKHGIQCLSYQRVGCSNSAVENFDLNTADEDSNILYLMFLKIVIV